MTSSFQNQVVEILPRLRAHAMALTCDRHEADDLLQETAYRALRAHKQFIPGTNFDGWMYRIMRNEFISRYRAKRRAHVDIDSVPVHALARNATQEDQLLVREILAAMGRLCPEQREVLSLVCMSGMDYAAAATALGCSIGTVKSRIFRARRHMQAFLMGGSHARQIETSHTVAPSAP